MRAELTIDIKVTINGSGGRFWKARLRTLGWCAWALRIPLGVTAP